MSTAWFGGARLSPDEAYRWLLWRNAPLAAASRVCTFVMLNPSTADATKDDATIRTCVAFADHWGFNSIEVVNLYAFRTPSPKVLAQVGYPVGDGNDEHIVAACGADSRRIILAWGAHAQPERAAHVRELIRTQARASGRTFALKINKDGSPAHPLYQPRNATLIPC